MQPAVSASSPQPATERPDGRLHAAATSDIRHLWCSDTDCTVLELCETPREAEDSSTAPHGLP